MKILITGGLGYIAENIYRIWSDKHDFTLCDYTVSHPDLPLAHHLSFENIQEFDGVIHLAALSGLFACENDPTLAVQENILTAMNVFAHATKAKIPVVFTSSQAAKDPKSSKYAFIKWACEQIASLYNQSGGMNYVIRLANVYGGYGYLEKKATCVKQFITNYNTGYPMRVDGDGSQERDFIHVFDVCRAIMNLFDIKPSDKSPMDIGTGKATSIMELVQMFPRKQNQHYEFIKGRNVGAGSSIAETMLAKNRIDFTATKKIEDYIKEMI